MEKKKILESFPQYPTPNIMRNIRVGNKKYYVTSQVEMFKGREYVLLAIFEERFLIINHIEPSYTIILDPVGFQFATWEHIPEKWRTCNINNIFYDYREISKAYIDQEDLELVKNKLGSTYSNLDKIVGNWQRGAKHHKIKTEIDSVMNKCRPLPKDFEEWVRNTVMLESRYIFYDYKRKVKKGFCTHCRKEVNINEPRHNKHGICPNCKSKIIFKSRGRQRRIEDTKACSYLEKHEDGFMERYFNIHMVHGPEEIIGPKLYMFEEIRNWKDKELNHVESYTFEEFKTTGEIRWCLQEWRYYSTSIKEHKGKIYTRNLKKILEDTPLKYSQLWTYTKKNVCFLNRFIQAYKKYPIIEMFIKSNMNNMAKAVIEEFYNVSQNIKLYEKKPTDIFGVNGQRVKRLIAMDATVEQVRLMQYEQIVDKGNFTDEVFITAKNVPAYQLKEINKYVRLNKAIRYLKKQKKICEYETIGDTVSQYLDYISLAQQLGYEITEDFILQPRDLKAEHDQAVEIVNEKEDQRKNKEREKKYKGIRTRYKKNAEKYEMEIGEYAFIVPTCPRDIALEGKTNHHCVGGDNYLKKMSEGISDIIFLRKKETKDTTYYTLEIKENKVIQAYSKFNKKPDWEEVKDLLDKYEKILKNKEIKNECINDRVSGL